MGRSEKAVVLVSGGIDSTVLLHLLREQGKEIHALSFHYGQRHSRELACARLQADRAGIRSFHLLDMGFMGELLKEGSSLMAAGAPVPDLRNIPEEQRDQPPTYVPNRNMLLLSVAAAYAESIGADSVYYGAQAQDEYGYWDCTPAFLEGMNALLALNRRRPIRIEAPLMHHSKADNVRLGLRLGVDFSETWSCYRGEDLACGVCPTCVERLKAFHSAGVSDPVPYQSSAGNFMDGERP